jgi:hypothetical protein
MGCAACTGFIRRCSSRSSSSRARLATTETSDERDSWPQPQRDGIRCAPRAELRGAGVGLVAVGSRRVWSPQLSPTSGEKGLSRTPAAFQTSAGDYVAEDNVKISIEFQKSALTKNANAALLCSVVSLGHGEMLGRRGLPLRPQRKSMAP